MKKALFVSMFATALIFAAHSSFAAGKVVANCSNGDETNVQIVQVAPDLYRADVTVQSTGDSYPTFHFKNVKELPRPSHELGAPTVYQGKGFEITIQYDALKAPAVLNAPSIGIDNDSSLNCN